MCPIIDIQNLSKIYASNTYEALKDINLTIQKGEILALLGPNGAGKTTLIGIVCGLIAPTQGHVLVNGYDVVKAYRQARSFIGLVPQELATDMFERVWDTVTLSRGIFGKPKDSHRIETVLKDLSLWDKRFSRIRELSGGMKRRVMIAKALAHDPQILFLDEPTAGVDVALRRDMWQLVSRLRDSGVTVILTTHYIEEAQAMADRIGIIQKGQLLLVEDKQTLMTTMGKKHVVWTLIEPLKTLPDQMVEGFRLSEDGWQLFYDIRHDDQAVLLESALGILKSLGIMYASIDICNRSLEAIFEDIVGGQ